MARGDGGLFIRISCPVEAPPRYVITARITRTASQAKWQKMARAAVLLEEKKARVGPTDRLPPELVLTAAAFKFGVGNMVRCRASSSK